MTRSFGIVEEKLCEAEFFFRLLKGSSPLDFDSRFYFSAFVSAARSITLVLQATMHGVAGFESWYHSVQEELRADPLARFFKKVRDVSVHTGLNTLNEVPLEHVREHLMSQSRDGRHSHVIVLPDLHGESPTVLADAVQASEEFFKSLVMIIYKCYDQFKFIVDPRWYYTHENFSAIGKTFEDAVVELGFPRNWASCAPEGDGGWRSLRLQQPPCQINHIFQEYLRLCITDPDDTHQT
ncbi:MAG: hypothetical protein F4049_13830 [Gemmatimonadetes bacterium]|nr:hypothetical protein [Gemmatimonadota bacterium]MYK41284.1 hypothetical protein [Gemmatimonadota bacterium]